MSKNVFMFVIVCGEDALRKGNGKSCGVSGQRGVDKKKPLGGERPKNESVGIRFLFDFALFSAFRHHF